MHRISKWIYLYRFCVATLQSLIPTKECFTFFSNCVLSVNQSWAPASLFLLIRYLFPSFLNLPTHNSLSGFQLSSVIIRKKLSISQFFAKIVAKISLAQHFLWQLYSHEMLRKNNKYFLWNLYPWKRLKNYEQNFMKLFWGNNPFIPSPATFFGLFPTHYL